MAGLAVARLSLESHSWHCLKVEKWHLTGKKPQAWMRQGVDKPRGQESKTQPQKGYETKEAAKQEVRKGLWGERTLALAPKSCLL